MGATFSHSSPSCKKRRSNSSSRRSGSITYNFHHNAHAGEAQGKSSRVVQSGGQCEVQREKQEGQLGMQGQHKGQHNEQEGRRDQERRGFGGK